MGSKIVSPKNKTYITILGEHLMTFRFSRSELTTSAGLDNDDLRFVLETEAVAVVEYPEDRVIREHIWCFTTVQSSTDSIQDAMRHEH